MFAHADLCVQCERQLRSRSFGNPMLVPARQPAQSTATCTSDALRILIDVAQSLDAEGGDGNTFQRFEEGVLPCRSLMH